MGEAAVLIVPTAERNVSLIRRVSVLQLIFSSSKVAQSCSDSFYRLNGLGCGDI